MKQNASIKTKSSARRLNNDFFIRFTVVGSHLWSECPYSVDGYYFFGTIKKTLFSLAARCRYRKLIKQTKSHEVSLALPTHHPFPAYQYPTPGHPPLHHMGLLALVCITNVDGWCRYRAILTEDSITTITTLKGIVSRTLHQHIVTTCANKVLAPRG